MNLDLFNNLINSTKENNVIKGFIKELGEFLENNLCDDERKKDSIVEKILDGKTLTTMYRDKINIERHDIISNYSKENSTQGEFYYVYSMGTDNNYGVIKHENGESGSDIWVKESQLPKGSGVDSVLRIKNGKFVLDKDATEQIQEKLEEMINKLLEEQNNTLEKQRVEGHIYELVEKTQNAVVLIDKTNYTGECFEEIDFSNELLDKGTKGDLFEYINGKYEFKI